MGLGYDYFMAPFVCKLDNQTLAFFNSIGLVLNSYGQNEITSEELQNFSIDEVALKELTNPCHRKKDSFELDPDRIQKVMENHTPARIQLLFQTKDSLNGRVAARIVSNLFQSGAKPVCYEGELTYQELLNQGFTPTDLGQIHFVDKNFDVPELKEMPVVRILKKYDYDSEWTGGASGMIISSDGRVASAYHVMYHEDGTLYPLKVQFRGHEYPVTEDMILSKNSEADLVIFRVDDLANLEGIKIPSLARYIGPGQKVVAVGFPNFMGEDFPPMTFSVGQLIRGERYALNLDKLLYENTLSKLQAYRAQADHCGLKPLEELQALLQRIEGDVPNHCTGYTDEDGNVTHTIVRIGEEKVVLTHEEEADALWHLGIVETLKEKVQKKYEGGQQYDFYRTTIDAAKGSSGGPLFVYEEGEWRLAGIASFVRQDESVTYFASLSGVKVGDTQN